MSEYLENGGMQILERNYRCKLGEVDIIGRHNGYLVFVEVKYRASTNRGYALQAVDVKKQRRICRVAAFYRASNRIGWNTAIRYDVVAVQGGKIQWLQNAFMHVG